MEVDMAKHSESYSLKQNLIKDLQLAHNQSRQVHVCDYLLVGKDHLGKKTNQLVLYCERPGQRFVWFG
jgi:hypothetical protein